jgi:nuclear pore complex protein Nup205
MNEEFQQGALQLSDIINLDEVESASIFLETQQDPLAVGSSLLESSVIKFHQRRQYLLDSLRLLLQQNADPEAEENIRDAFQVVIDDVLQKREGPDNKSKFVRKCLTSMGDIKSWLQGLADKLNSISVLGQASQPEIAAIIEYQRVSLIQQHESLGVILYYLIKSNCASFSDFEQLLATLKAADKYDSLLGKFRQTVFCALS